MGNVYIISIGVGSVYDCKLGAKCCWYMLIKELNFLLTDAWHNINKMATSAKREHKILHSYLLKHNIASTGQPCLKNDSLPPKPRNKRPKT